MEEGVKKVALTNSKLNLRITGELQHLQNLTCGENHIKMNYDEKRLS